MFKFFLQILLSASLLFFEITNAQIYVSVDGDDNNPGTIEEPLASVREAIRKIDNVGDTVYVRGGVYNIFSPINTSNPGLPDNYNKIWAYPGEKPIFDFSEQPFNSSARGIVIDQKYWHIKGLEIRGCGDNGIYITADSNKVENCITHHNRDTGIQISGGAGYNIIINCDSYYNFDTGSRGENADGFAAKLDIGPGNEFHGCRAWGNSDDGWDLYESEENVLIDSCWAFKNGYNIWNISNFEGDGNGFKMGGNYKPANHIITNSVAFHNRSKGFDQNHNTSGITVYNCTAWKNGRNYVFPQPPQDSIVSVFKNNISFDGLVDIDNTSIEENNSWQGFNVSVDDFRSLDTSLATMPRIWNNKLPQNDFLRLNASSSLVDAGVDIGFDFNGSAPDLGAFEFGTILSAESENVLPSRFVLYQNYPNPFNPVTKIKFVVAENELRFTPVKLLVYNVLGEIVSVLFDESIRNGEYEIYFNAERLSSGVYFYSLQAGEFKESKKVIILK